MVRVPASVGDGRGGGLIPGGQWVCLNVDHFVFTFFKKQPYQGKCSNSEW